MATKAVNLRPRHVGREAILYAGLGTRVTRGKITQRNYKSARYGFYNVGSFATYRTDMVEFVDTKSASV